VDFQSYNCSAWDRQVELGDQWTVPASDGSIELARQGQGDISVTPSRAIPTPWFPGLEGADVLCPASGGRKQGPILTAAGAAVTVLDHSPKQLAQDLFVAARLHRHASGKATMQLLFAE
jgi:hypothetical protein